MSLFRRRNSESASLPEDVAQSEAGAADDDSAAEQSAASDENAVAAAASSASTTLTDGESGDSTGSDSTGSDSESTPKASPPRVALVRGEERGPWDVDEIDDAVVRVDLGALRIPGRPGMALRMELDRNTRRVIAANVTLGQSNLQLQAFAAPRTAGLWDEIRAQIGQSVQAQGGAVQETVGPFGKELLALLPVKDAEGKPARRPARFVGADGPRWFVRGVLTGAAVADRSAARQMEEYFASIVVVRGTEARPPRELLTLTMPGRPAAAPTEAEGEEILGRGPEISEVR